MRVTIRYTACLWQSCRRKMTHRTSENGLRLKSVSSSFREGSCGHVEFMLVTLDCTASQWKNIIKTSTETFPNCSHSALIRFCSSRTLSVSPITIICHKAKHTASASGYCLSWCCWASPQVYLAAFWQSSDSWEQCFKGEAAVWAVFWENDNTLCEPFKVVTIW